MPKSRRTNPLFLIPDPLIRRKIRIDENGCWIWTGYTRPEGYGVITRNKRGHRAHRYVYELVMGEIPTDLVLDHQCHVRPCVNPRHLTPVTLADNGRRKHDWQVHVTKCPQGHLYQGDNLIVGKNGHRWCRECKRIRQREYMRKKLGIPEARYGVHTSKSYVPE